MSFYSLLVRDPKRGWIVATESTNEQAITATGNTVSKSPQYRVQVLVTDGNSRNIEAGLAFVKKVNGKGLARLFGFTRLSTVHP